MLDQDFSNFSELAQSGISELGNVIVGQASTNLSELGYRTQILVPAFVVGKGSQISTLGLAQIVIPFEIEWGKLDLNLALRIESLAANLVNK